VKSLIEKEFVVLTATNGREALEIMKNQNPDVILSDVMMPEMDGIQFLQCVKSNELWKDIPFVLFSAKSSLESRLAGLAEGADHYIPKPFNPEELKLILRNITNKIEKTRSEFAAQKTQKKPFSERLQSDNDYLNKALKFRAFTSPYNII
jgi:DNA-binding response OmpR family regulator